MDERGEAEVGSIQPHTHSFVVKVWLADPERPAGTSGWRGRITHVPSGHAGHFSDLRAVAAFIAPYLQALGVRPAPAPSRRARRWLRGDG